MSVDTVVVKKDRGPLVLRVNDPQHPQGITAVVWRFVTESRRDPEHPVAQFTAQVSEVPLGSPDAVNGIAFLIDGFIKPFGDNPASTYQVVVTISQGGLPVHQVIPPDRGNGTVGSEPVRFRYPFRVEVQ